MPVSAEFRDFVLEQLESAGPVTTKSMFGGVGLYGGEDVFGIIFNDALYFKVDDSTRSDFEAAGMNAFKPFENKPPTLQYYQVPPGVLEDRDLLGEWARKAISAAGKTGKKKSPAKKAGTKGRATKR